MKSRRAATTSVYGFSIFATVRGPIRLRPRTIYRIGTVCFPASCFGFVRRSVALAFTGSADCLESLRTILVGAAFGFRVRSWDCPHSHSPIRLRLRRRPFRGCRPAQRLSDSTSGKRLRPRRCSVPLFLSFISVFLQYSLRSVIGRLFGRKRIGK